MLKGKCRIPSSEQHASWASVTVTGTGTIVQLLLKVRKAIDFELRVSSPGRKHELFFLYVAIFTPDLAVSKYSKEVAFRPPY